MKELLSNGTETEKTCPLCGAKLIVRTNRTTQHQFLGCPRWPDCQHTESIPEQIRMRLSGQPELFDVSRKGVLQT